MSTHDAVKTELLEAINKITEIIPEVSGAIHQVDRLQEVFVANHTIQDIFKSTPREEIEAMVHEVENVNLEEVFRITQSIEATFADLPLDQFADAIRSADSLHDVFIVMNTIQQTIADYLGKKIMHS